MIRLGNMSMILPSYDHMRNAADLSCKASPVYSKLAVRRPSEPEERRFITVRVPE
jgi:hypothetical protein